MCYRSNEAYISIILLCFVMLWSWWLFKMLIFGLMWCIFPYWSVWPLYHWTDARKIALKDIGDVYVPNHKKKCNKARACDIILIFTLLYKSKQSMRQAEINPICFMMHGKLQALRATVDRQRPKRVIEWLVLMVHRGSRQPQGRTSYYLILLLPSVVVRAISQMGWYTPA